MVLWPLTAYSLGNLLNHYSSDGSMDQSRQRSLPRGLPPIRRKIGIVVKNRVGCVS